MSDNSGHLTTLLTDRLYTAYNWCPSGECILDVGCSTGYFMKYLLKKASIVCGVDIDKQSVVEARKMGPDCKCSIASAASLPFATSHFDVVTFLDVLEHLQSQQDKFRAICEVHRVLKDNGLLIFSVPP